MERRSERLGLTRSIVHVRHFDDIVAAGSVRSSKGGSDVPSCARGVLLPLRRLLEDGVLEDEASEGKEEDGRRSLFLDPCIGFLKEAEKGTSLDDDDVCVGMLIRDDIIVTLSACSEHCHKFVFSGVGTLDAVPHSSLNARQQTNNTEDDVSSQSVSSSLDPRLDFLLTNPPHHHHFLDRPVRRARMILSLQSKWSAGIVGSGGVRNINNRTKVMDMHDRKRTAVARCDGPCRFVAHNFPVDGELVLFGDFVRVLPDNDDDCGGEAVLLEDVDGAAAYLSEKVDDKTGEVVDRWWKRCTCL